MFFAHFNIMVLIIFLFIISEKSKNLKYDGIKSIIGGENSAGGNILD